MASAVRAGGQGEAIAAFLSLIQTREDIGIDKGRTDRLGDGEWLAGHRRPSQPDRPGAPNDPIVRFVLKATVVNLEVRKPAKWGKVAGESYAHVVQGSKDEPTSLPRLRKSPEHHVADAAKSRRDGIWTDEHPRRGFIKLEDTAAVTESGYEIFGERARGWNRGGRAAAQS